jgi:hypothetical protein
VVALHRGRGRCHVASKGTRISHERAAVKPFRRACASATMRSSGAGPARVSAPMLAEASAHKAVPRQKVERDAANSGSAAVRTLSSAQRRTGRLPRPRKTCRCAGARASAWRSRPRAGDVARLIAEADPGARTPRCPGLIGAHSLALAHSLARACERRKIHSHGGSRRHRSDDCSALGCRDAWATARRACGNEEAELQNGTDMASENREPCRERA